MDLGSSNQSFISRILYQINMRSDVNNVKLETNQCAKIESWFPKQYESLALTEWLVTSEMVKQ